MRSRACRVTCIDNGMPVVCIKADDLGLTGHESPSEIEANADVKRRIEDDPAGRRAADESRRRRQQDGAEDDAGVDARNTAAPSTPAPSSRTAYTRRSVCSARSRSRPPAWCPGRLPPRSRRSTTHAEVEIEHPTGFFTVSMDVEHRRRRRRGQASGAAADSAAVDARRRVRAGIACGRADEYCT